MDEHDNKTGWQKQGGWTPGRWTFSNDRMTGAVWAEKEFIASVFPNAPEGWNGFSEYPRVKEMRANARLIAAAPDLYTALEELLTASETDYGAPDDGDGDDEAVAHTTTGGVAVTFGMLRRARAALSRANPSTNQGGE